MPTESNPYQPSVSIATDENRGSGSVLRFLLRALIGYYVLSVVTFQFADDFWLGELPILGLVQIPKSMFYSVVRHQMVEAMRMLGISYSSASPDAIAATPWAFGVVFLTPITIAFGVIAALRRVKEFRRELVALTVFAVMDAVGTLYFEAHHD